MTKNIRQDIQKAIKIVKDGGVIIYPTDTAFGIGCRMDSIEAVDRLFSIRERPRTQATPVLVASESMALSYLKSPSHIVRHFMNKYWPGALTIVAPCAVDLVYSPIRGDSETIGFRMPNHQTILEIIRGVGVPVLGPSANIHGKQTPYTYETLDKELTTLVDMVVWGECQVGLASTVVDCTKEPYQILRQGSVVL